MRFREEYTTTAIAEAGKTTISNEAYAICDMIQKLIDIMEKKKW